MQIALALMLITSVLAGPSSVARQANTAATDRFNYKGYIVDVTAIRSAPNASVVREALQQQIDIVENVRLRPEQREFFKTVPIAVIAVESGPPAQVAEYSSGSRGITVRSYIQRIPNPILLHELLHAYHHQRLGWANPEIQKLFAQAKAEQRFPPDSYMLTNVAEYFAMMGSVYLHGKAARDPLTRENLKEKQADCHDWFEREFGSR